MSGFPSKYSVLLLLVGAGFPGLLPAIPAAEKSPQELWTNFSEQWNPEAWEKKIRSFPDGYMRPLEDPGWKLRMHTLQGLVSQGQESIPLLVRALQEGKAYERALAAQTLGYLPDSAPHEPLLQAAQSDPEAVIRLYAVDALARQGKKQAADWKAFLKKEKNRDVRKHIGYAIERKGTPLDRQVTKSLREWDLQNRDSAQVGKPAPDFQLETATGGTVRLKDFRGKQAVVLVFIYGDT